MMVVWEREEKIRYMVFFLVKKIEFKIIFVIKVILNYYREKKICKNLWVYYYIFSDKWFNDLMLELERYSVLFWNWISFIFYF